MEGHTMSKKKRKAAAPESAVSPPASPVFEPAAKPAAKAAAAVSATALSEPAPAAPRWILAALLTLYTVLTLLLIACVPSAATPDEAGHWQYVEHLAVTRSLPVFKGQPPPEPGYEFHQPPLYYLLCAPLWAGLPAGAQQYACRFVALLCGLATVFVVWKTARRVFPDDPLLPGLAAFIAALSPLHQGVNASSNNDSLGGLIAALLFALTARAFLQPVSWRAIFWLGLVAGAGLWTKNTCLVVAAMAFAGLFWALKNQNQDEKTPSPGAGTLCAIAVMLAVGAPLLWRNQWLYGDPLGVQMFSRAASKETLGFPEFSEIVSLGGYARGLLWQIFLTAWGFFGGPTTVANLTRPLSAGGPRVPQGWIFLAFPMLLCALLPLLCVLGWRRLPPLDDARRRLWTVWSGGAALVFLAWAQFAYAHFSGGQARYLHPAFLPICLFAAAGWVGLWGRGRAFWVATAASGALMLGLTLLNLILWRTLV